MKVFNVKVGKAAGVGECTTLRYFGDYYVLIKPIKRKDGNNDWLELRFELTELFWDKKDPEHPVAHYEEHWFNEDGDVVTAQRVLTIMEELKLEIGL